MERITSVLPLRPARSRVQYSINSQCQSWLTTRKLDRVNVIFKLLYPKSIYGRFIQSCTEYSSYCWFFLWHWNLKVLHDNESSMAIAFRTQWMTNEECFKRFWKYTLIYLQNQPFYIISSETRWQKNINRYDNYLLNDNNYIIKI